MAEAARLAEAEGAHGIDINMGCPAKRVTGGWAGSALMRDLDHATRLIAAVTSAVSLPVTVKMRLGWDSGCLNAAELARRAERCGVAGLVVHGRTRQQFYKGRADWGAIAAVVRAVSVPVIANGDIADAADARRCLADSGAAGVMVGRAALGRPWLVGRIAAELSGRAWREPSRDEQLEAVLTHHEHLCGSMGEAAGLRHARKHLVAYLDHAAASGNLMAARVRQAVATSDDPAAIRALLRRAYREDEGEAEAEPAPAALPVAA
jgi:nifR3 family TIM-barrel protein